jgi:hypothetical protein
MDVVRRSGTGLVGIDITAVALTHAPSHAEASKLRPTIGFRRGDLRATGLDDASVDATIRIDTTQFADSTVGALVECRRMRPGGRVVLTSGNHELAAMHSSCHACGTWLCKLRGGKLTSTTYASSDTAMAPGGAGEVDSRRRHRTRRTRRHETLQDEAQRVLPLLDLTRRLDRRPHPRPTSATDVVID